MLCTRYCLRVCVSMSSLRRWAEGLSQASSFLTLPVLSTLTNVGWWRMSGPHLYFTLGEPSGERKRRRFAGEPRCVSSPWAGRASASRQRAGLGQHEEWVPKATGTLSCDAVLIPCLYSQADSRYYTKMQIYIIDSSCSLQPGLRGKGARIEKAQTFISAQWAATASSERPRHISP